MNIKDIVKSLLGNNHEIIRKINLFRDLITRWVDTPRRVYYNKIFAPKKILKIRSKTQIKVAFIVHELASWKTESLYLRMLQHGRFSPQLIAVPSMHNKSEIENVISYFKRNNYKYSMLRSGDNICKELSPDIIFYQKPYSSVIPKSLYYGKNLDALFCYVYYSFRNKTLPESQNALIHGYIWQEYIENSIVKEELVKLMDNHAKNTLVTGLPVMDELLKPKSEYEDPWVDKSGRKRIIYAPHHSIRTYKLNGALGGWSTFLLYGEYMQDLAIKYKDEITIAFKPHPLLYPNLSKIWGIDRTDRYYRKWGEIDNAQTEMGAYMGLFKHSDAMIHDCGSFMIEYLYTQNPVQYLVLDEHHNDNVNQQTEDAYYAHYLGMTKDDIEKFILNVIRGEDSMKCVRESYYNKYLLPPNNNMACDNIIDAILG